MNTTEGQPGQQPQDAPPAYNSNSEQTAQIIYAPQQPTQQPQPAQQPQQVAYAQVQGANAGANQMVTVNGQQYMVVIPQQGQIQPQGQPLQVRGGEGVAGGNNVSYAAQQQQMIPVQAMQTTQPMQPMQTTQPMQPMQPIQTNATTTMGVPGTAQNTTNQQATLQSMIQRERCCCCDIKTGITVLAVLFVINDAYYAYYWSAWAAYYSSYFYIFFFISLIGVFASIAGAYGAVQLKKDYVRVFYYYLIVQLVFVVIVYIYLVSYYGSSYIINLILYALLYGYFVYVTRKLYLILLQYT